MNDVNFIKFCVCMIISFAVFLSITYTINSLPQAAGILQAFFIILFHLNYANQPFSARKGNQEKACKRI